MKTTPHRRIVAALISAALSLTLLAAPAFAAPDIDQNSGVWTDAYSDASGLELGPVGGEPGQSVEIYYDPFGRLVTLDAGAASGYFYTTPITPSSFSAWGRVYVDFTSATLGGVTIKVYNAVTGADLGTLALTASDDPAYARMAELSTLPALVGTGVTSIRLRVTLARGASAIAPTVQQLKVTWAPRSVLAVALEAPATRPAGDAIVLRVAVSASYVNAQSFVAWVPAPTALNNLYGQPAALTFVSATDGGQYTTVAIGPVPANSVYWTRPTLTAGNTLAYYATFRSNNGLVQGLTYPFQASVASANSGGLTVSSAIRSTMLTATANGYLQKTSAGTYFIGGQAHAARNSTITQRITAGDWLFQSIPTGAQAWNDTIVYDSYQDFITKAAISGGPTSISAGGQFTTVALTNAQDARIPVGVTVPANSVWWDLATMNLGVVQSLSYQLTINGTVADNLTVKINDCTTVPKETVLSSGQQSDPATPVINACTPAGSCGPITTCHPIIIGVDNTPGYAFAKGDEINGSAAIRGAGWNDNPGAFVTFGDPIHFKLSVGNSAVSKLNDVVLFDVVPAGTTFSSATLPAAANGTVWYYTGAASPTPPTFFVSPTNPASDAVVSHWQQSPRPATVTWVAFWIPELASTYFPTTVTSVVADFTVTVNTTGAVCTPSVVDNVGYALFPRYTPLTGPGAGSELAYGAGTTQVSDSERVDVKAILPNLGASTVSGPGSLASGATGVWNVTVYNLDRNGNPVDTALTARAVIPIPQVVANGEARYLSLLGLSTGGGAVTYQYDPLTGAVSQVTVTWPSILPQQNKLVQLTLGTPLGIRNNTAITVSAALSASDDFACAPITANPSSQTVITSSPALEVRKDVDLTVVAPGTTYHYALRYTNRGTAPSSQTWVVDRLPDGLTVVDATGPAYGEVWFADYVPLDPTNPGAGGALPALSSSVIIDDAVIRSYFTRATTEPSPGRYTAPAGTRWVAFLVDDPTFDPAVSPPILGVGLNGLLDVTVQVSPSALTGTILENEALIDSAELLQSIGNRVVTVVSSRPGLDLVKTCPEVISNGEEFSYRIEWVNDTTNQDDVVTLVETFPLGFVPDFANVTSSEPLVTPVVTSVNGRGRATWTFPPQSSLDTAWLEIPGEFVGVASNVYAANEVVGIAENLAGTFSVSETCTTQIQNPDLFMRKLVDVADPRSGETVTFTLTVSNENARRAEAVLVTDTLPTGLSYVVNTLDVVTPGWELVGPLPLDGATSLALRLIQDGGTAQLLPGNSGPITIVFQARVALGVLPGSVRTNSVTVTSSTEQDPTLPPGSGNHGVFTDTATATITTPLPDPYLTMTGPALVKPGETLTWSILYGNATREDATGVVVLLRFPEGPTADNAADFSYLAHISPPGVQSTWFSAYPLNTPPPITSAASPGAAWTTTPTIVNGRPVVNYMLFSVGNLAALQGPFPISITVEAREQDGQLSAIGQAFTARAEIRMIGAPYLDANTGNNIADVTTRTPSVDLAIALACTPSGVSPGLPPGEIIELVLDFENTGTVNVYGITITPQLAGLLTLESHSAASVVLTSADGFQVGPVDAAGVRVDLPVSWTFDGTTFAIGQTTDANAPGYYRGYGLAPGDSGSITIRARVNGTTPDTTPFASSVTIATAGRVSGVDGPDQVTDNNTDLCGSIVYRADPFILKSVANTTGASNLAEAGDTLTYTLPYGNAGNFAASGVAISDNLPAGTTFVPGSLTGVPANATAEYDNGTFNWQPIADENTTAVRVRWNDGAELNAPANSGFFATTQADFQLGTFDNNSTIATADGSVVAVAGTSQLLTYSTLLGFPNPVVDMGRHFSDAPVDVQVVMDPTHFMPIDAPNTPVALTSVAFDRRRSIENGGSFAYSTQSFELEIGYLNPALEPAPGASYTLQANNESNYAIGTKVLVHQGPLSSGAGEGFTFKVPFSTPFVYDPALGSLLITYRAGAFNGVIDIIRYINTTNPPRGDITMGGMSQPFGSNETFNLHPPRFQFETAAPAAGTYTSPTFPNVDQGNVIRWGRVVTTATMGDPADENLTIDVVTPDGTVVLADIIPDGSGAYDLSSLSPLLYPELRLRAAFEGKGAQCMTDLISPATPFDGFPTGLNASGDAIGLQDRNPTSSADDNLTAWVWSEGDDAVTDLHAFLPVAGVSAPTAFQVWDQSFTSGINDAGTVVGWADPNPNFTLNVPTSCMRDGPVGFTPVESLIVWQPSASGWRAACLPEPNLVQPIAYPASLEPKATLAHINQKGMVAASAGIFRTRAGDAEPMTLGTATVWCVDPTAPSGYRASPIAVDVGDGTIPAKQATVTGLNDADVVIGVGYFAAEQFRGYAWRPTTSDAGGCPTAWQQVDLSVALWDYLKIVAPTAPQPTEIVPLDIDALGNIVGLYRVDSGAAYKAVRWSLRDGIYVARTISAPGDALPNAMLPQTVSGTNYPDRYASAATTSIAAGRAYFTAFGSGAEFDAWSFEGDIATLISNAAAIDFLSGAAGTTALGVSGDGKAPFETWGSFAGSRVALGSILPIGTHAPLFANADDLVIGSYSDNVGVEAIDRVFKWRACSQGGTPSLDSWSVTYETDRPPQLTFQVTVDDYCQQQIVNGVDISTSTPEIRDSNNHAEASIPLNNADLEVVVAASRSVVSPLLSGQPTSDQAVTFSAAVTNLGAGTSNDVVLRFTPPPAAAFSGAAPQIVTTGVANDGGAVDANGDFVITLDALVPGQDFQVDWSGFNLLATPDSLLAASASADALTVDCSAGNDVGSGAVVVGSYPNLWVTIEGPAFATSGQALTYTIHYGNSGNVAATGVSVTQTLPAGTTFTSASVTPTSVTPTTLTWAIGNVAAGATGTLVVTLAGPSCEDAGGDFDTFVTIDGSEPESSVSDNDALASTFITPSSDELALTVVSSHASAQAGEQVAATVYFHNTETRAVGGADLRVDVPGGAARYVNGSASIGGTLVGNTISWPVGTLLPGEAGSVTFRYVASIAAAPAFASIDAIGACGEVTPITPPTLVAPGLNVFKSASTGTVCGDDAVGGVPVDWTITVTNTAAIALANVVVTDALPAGTTYSGGITGVGGSVVDPTNLTWTIPSLPARSALTLGYTSNVTNSAPGVLVNAVTAAHAAGQISVIGAGAVAIDCGPHAVLSKSWTGACQTAGAPVGVTLTLTNDGDVAIRNGTISDHVPAGLDVVLPSGGQGFVYDTARRTVTFTVAQLLIGESATYTFDTTPAASQPAGVVITNRAAMRADGFPVLTSNQVAGAFLACGDNNVCTTDTCSGATGCINTPTPIAGVTDLCDGLDNDCDAGVDEDFVPSPTECGVGACYTTAMSVCLGVAGVGPNCTPPAPGLLELCNITTDDDCDGITDEGFELVGDACDGDDTDLCQLGVYGCSTNMLATICNETVHKVELCNALDDTCNGVIDETFVTLGNSCDGTDADLCPNGVVICAPGDTTTIACSETGAGLFESCNGRDDNCNGAVDETFFFGALPIGTACDGNDVGSCTRGIVVCDLEGNTTLCNETGTDPTLSPCSVGLGVCRNTGLLTCDGACDVAALAVSTAEVCNGLDDDCDGFVDDPGATPPICRALETDIVTGPPAITAATTATFTYVNPLATPVASHTTFQCSLDGAAWTACNHVGATPSLTYSGLTAGQHTLLVRATANDGSVDPTPDFWTWLIDLAVPDTIIVSAPTDPSQNPSGTIVFGSPTPNPDFYMCVLDPANAAAGVCPVTGDPAYTLCPTTFVFTNLAEGLHTICGYVTNTAGTPDPIPASYTWLIDSVPPETEIVAVIPPKVTASTSVIFHYIDPTAPTTDTFECSLDGTAWVACDGKTTDYADLAEGEHTFDVRTIDPNGVADPTPASFTWLIDLTAPCPTIVSHPSDPAQSSTAVFGFSADEPDVSWYCALDPTQLGANGEPLLAAYSPCAATTTYSNLADGSHRLWVYAVDPVGNLGSCRASYTWLIDSRFPETEITAGPTPLTGTGEVVTFDYIDPENEDTITFECKLDGAPLWTTCNGTIVGDGGTIDYEDLPIGRHVFEVRTCDFTKAAPIQCDPTPAMWTWQVTASTCPNDATAPTLDCVDDLVLDCQSGGATVDLATLTPLATDACMPVDVSTSASGTLGVGQTPIVFIGTDGNGNMASCVTLVDVVDVTAPQITCPADIVNGTTDAGVCTAAIDIAAARGNDGCQGDVGLLVLDDAPELFIPGETAVTHHVVDAFGNEAVCTQRVVVVDDEALILTCSPSRTVDADPDKCEWTGVTVAHASDNCSGELDVEVEGRYDIGESPVLFSVADDAGNADTCTTLLTVRDVTPPVVTCGSAVGLVPSVIRASASDACQAVVTLEAVTCASVSDGVATPITLGNCPITVTGDTLEVTGRLTAGSLAITYDARAVDPSGNVATVACSQTYAPDRDADGTIDADDNCVAVVNGDQTDGDDDGIGDLCDVCPTIGDVDQADRDGDRIGDACSDRDADGVLDSDDNCELSGNTDQADLDQDGVGDVCDPDTFDALSAEGGGGCSGGAGGLFGGLIGIAGLLIIAARRRVASR